MRIVTESCFDIGQKMVRIEKTHQPKMCPTCSGKAVMVFSNERGTSVQVPCFMCSGKGLLEKETIEIWSVSSQTYRIKEISCQISSLKKETHYTFFYQIQDINDKQEELSVPEHELFMTRKAAELICHEHNEHIEKAFIK